MNQSFRIETKKPDLIPVVKHIKFLYDLFCAAVRASAVSQLVFAT